MKCANPRCSCGTVDGGFCAEACVAAQYASKAVDSCDCAHTGCQPIA